MQCIILDNSNSLLIQDKILGLFDLTQRGLTVNLEFVIEIPLLVEPLP